MQRSYEKRRWLRDGGRGGAGLSRRGACCCGVSIVTFVFSSSGRRAPAKRAAADRRLFFSLLQRLGQAGDENTPPPLRIAPQALAGNKSATRERVFFCDGLAAWRPMPGGFFFLSFLLRFVSRICLLLAAVFCASWVERTVAQARGRGRVEQAKTEKRP